MSLVSKSIIPFNLVQSMEANNVFSSTEFIFTIVYEHAPRNSFNFVCDVLSNVGHFTDFL